MESEAAEVLHLSSPLPSLIPNLPDLQQQLPDPSLLLHHFLRPTHEQPTVAYDRFERQDELPSVDLSTLRPEFHSAARKDCLRDLVRACREWGFFRIVNHSVPVELMKQMDAEARKMFGLPFERKLQSRDPEGGTLGFCSGAQKEYNLQGNWQESFQFPGDKDSRKAFLEKTMQHDHQDFRATLEQYVERVEQLGEEVANHLAVALGLPPTRFSNNCRTLVVRCSYYPPCTDPNSTLGLIPHSDALVLTLLQDDHVSGLQILKDGSWITVRPHPGTFIVNVGDILQILSNDLLDSVVHRVVVNRENARLSVVTFFGPDSSTLIVPEPELATVTKEHSSLSKYRPFTYGDYWELVETADFRGKDLLESFRNNISVSEACNTEQ